MKKLYIEPSIDVHSICMSQALLTTSGLELYLEEETSPDPLIDEQLSRMLLDAFEILQ